MLDLSVPENNYFFRIKEKLANISNVDEADAINTLLQAAEEMYNEIRETTSESMIDCRKHDGTTIIRTKLTENDLLKEIDKMINYHYDVENAVTNSLLLARHYKKSFYVLKIYEPFFDEVFKLLQRSTALLSTSKRRDIIAEISSLKAELKTYQSKIIEKDAVVNRLERSSITYKNTLRRLILNKKFFTFYVDLVNKKVPDSGNFLNIVIYLLLNGRSKIDIMLRDINVDKKEFGRIATEQSKYLIIIAKEDSVDLNYDTPELKSDDNLSEAESVIQKIDADVEDDVQVIHNKHINMSAEKTIEKKPDKIHIDADSILNEVIEKSITDDKSATKIVKVMNQCLTCGQPCHGKICHDCLAKSRKNKRKKDVKQVIE